LSHKDSRRYDIYTLSLRDALPILDELNGGNWIPVTPDTVYDFSAVGYFFSKKIYDKYNIPIGLLFTAIGGTPAEAWISEGSLMRSEEHTSELQSRENIVCRLLLEK